MLGEVILFPLRPVVTTRRRKKVENNRRGGEKCSWYVRPPLTVRTKLPFLEKSTFLQNGKLLNHLKRRPSQQQHLVE